MIKRFALLLPLLLCISFPALANEPIRVIEGKVIKVNDGDTIQVRDNLGTKVKVRLYGIDAPETEKTNKKTGRVSKPGQPYGGEAYQALKDKVGGQRVKVEVIEIDRYKRAVSKVWNGKRNINQEMVREGYAWAYRHYLDYYDAVEYTSAEDQAKLAKRGLWQQSNPQPPWEFRKSLKRK